MTKPLPLLFLCLLLAACAAPPEKPVAVAVPIAPAARTVHRMPPAALQVCDQSLDHMLRGLQKNARYAYTADAIDSQARVHMWYINSLTRAWAQVRVYDDLHACIENTGRTWRWAPLPKGPAKPEETGPQPPCDKNIDHMLRELGKNPGEAYTGAVVDDRKRVYKWYVNNATLTWMQIRVYRDRHACIENSGGDWHWAAGG